MPRSIPADPQARALAPHQGSQLGACVVLPTYNERENLERMVALLRQLPEAPSIIVVDDASPDGTGELADALAARDSRIRVLHRPGKAGLGTAYLAGFALALEAGHQLILTMDCDFSHHPRYVPQLLRRAEEGADLVIGSRYVPGGGTPDFPLSRKILSGSANLVAHVVAGLKARDTTAGFRCYHRRVLETLPLGKIRSNGYSFLVEMLFLIQNAGFRIEEVPIVFEDRKAGKSKISRQEIYKAIHVILRLGLRRLGLGRFARE